MRSYQKNRGFSTLEVLAAVAIVIILAMIVLGAGKRLQTQADERLAKSTIEILVTAIGQYYEFWDEFPAVEDDPADPCDTPAEHSEELYRQLYSTPNSKSICEQIQATQIGDTSSPPNDDLEFLDPWGQPLITDIVPATVSPRLNRAGRIATPVRWRTISAAKICSFEFAL